MADNKKDMEDVIGKLEKSLFCIREGGEVVDAEELDAIITLLQKYDALEEPHMTKEEAYENIIERAHAGAEEIDERGRSEYSSSNNSKSNNKKKVYAWLRKRGARAAIIVAVVAGVILSLNSVAYAVGNKSLFTVILEKAGVLEIEKEEGVEGTLVDAGKAEKEFYSSWSELEPALRERITVPEYIPEGYSLYGIRCWDSNNREIIQSNYYDQGNGHLLFEIILWRDNTDHHREMVVEEDENRLISECSDENTMYYQYEDEYICLAFEESVFYRISGNITLEEMIKIREGVGISDGR